MTLGQRIRQLRTSRGLSLSQLSSVSKIDRTLISRYETGKVCPPRVRVVAIAAALGVTEVGLIRGTD